MSSLGCLGIATPNHAHHGYQQERHDVDDLDERVDCRACGVLVGVAHGVAGHRGFVCIRALATVMAFFNILFRVIPGATACTHRNRDEKAGHDGAHENPAKRRWAQEHTNQNWHHDGQNRWHDHFLNRCCGE